MLDKEVMKTLHNVYYYSYVKVTYHCTSLIFLGKTDDHTIKKTPNELTAVLNSLAWCSGLV